MFLPVSVFFLSLVSAGHVPYSLLPRSVPFPETPLRAKSFAPGISLGIVPQPVLESPVRSFPAQPFGLSRAGCHLSIIPASLTDCGTCSFPSFKSILVFAPLTPGDSPFSRVGLFQFSFPLGAPPSPPIIRPFLSSRFTGSLRLCCPSTDERRVCSLFPPHLHQNSAGS